MSSIANVLGGGGSVVLDSGIAWGGGGGMPGGGGNPLPTGHGPGCHDCGGSGGYDFRESGELLNTVQVREYKWCVGGV